MIAAHEEPNKKRIANPTTKLRFSTNAWNYAERTTYETGGRARQQYQRMATVGQSHGFQKLPPLYLESHTMSFLTFLRYMKLVVNCLLRNTCPGSTWGWDSKSLAPTELLSACGSRSHESCSPALPLQLTFSSSLSMLSNVWSVLCRMQHVKNTLSMRSCLW